VARVAVSVRNVKHWMTADFDEEVALYPSPRKNSVRIGLFGMYASANLGDTAIQTVVMAALRSRRPDIDFVGLSPDPEDVVRTHLIPGFPASGEGVLVTPQHGIAVDSRSKVGTQTVAKRLVLSRRILALRNIDRQVQDIDMLLISGGGQIDDFWGGPWQQPFRLFTWCLCARLHRKPIAAFALGVDGLHRRLSAWFATHALQMAGYRTFRDTGSLDALRHEGLSSVASVCPDPAFAFCATLPSSIEEGASKRSKFAVISPISSHAFPGASDVEYDSYLTALATVAEELRQQGIEVRFMCSQTRMDPPVVARVTARMKTDAGVSMADVNTVDDFVSAVSGAELVVASRLHAVILSLVAGTPVIAVSPARKVRQQMIDVGLADYCFDLRSVQASALLSRVQTAVVQRQELYGLISSRVKELRKQLDGAFDQLAKVIPPNVMYRRTWH
jgi:polysaccharide pyruvyl transferase WcaK-like protein